MTSVSSDRRQGLNSGAAIKVPAQVATTANIALAGLQTIDGVVLAADDRVLVKDQTNTAENGIYDADTGNWTRSLDFDGAYDPVEGTLVTVLHGATYAATLWRISTATPAIGNALAFVQSSLSPSDSNNVQFLQSGAGAVARMVQSKEREIVSVFDFMTAAQIADVQAGTVALDVYAPIAVAVTAAAGGILYFPPGTYRTGTSIEINDQAGAGVYRKATKIIGAGIGKTRILNRAAGPAFTHYLTQAQGDNSYFARGLEIAGLEIYTDGTSTATSRGIALEGAYNPWIHDVLISSPKGNGIETLAAALWPADPDRYSCADVTLERVTVVNGTAWAVYSTAIATGYKIDSPYFTSNVGGGVYLQGSLHVIHGGSISGNGAAADAASCGIKLARESVLGATPESCRVEYVELDGNYNRQVVMQSTNSLVDNCKIIDAVSAGAYRCTKQIEVIAIAGMGADSNTIRHNFFRLGSMGAANTIGIAFNLDVPASTRSVRYNIADRNVFSYTEDGAGRLTEVSYGSNPTDSLSVGNREYTPEAPKGTTFTGSIAYNIATASGTVAITGVGFKPNSLLLDGFIETTILQSQGYVATDLGNRGKYYYGTGPTFVSNGANVALTFRTGAGDLAEATITSFDTDGFTITWTKTGAPAGNATIKYMATR